MKRLQNRLSVLGIAVATALLAALAAAPAEAKSNNKGMSTIPLKVVNKSGQSGKLYVLVIGQSGSDWYYVKDKSGNVTKFADNLGYSAYGLKFGSQQKFTLRIPELVHSRVYFSFGQKIQLNTGSTGAPSSPAGWTSTDPNYNTLFDWFEYGWQVQDPPISTLPPNATLLNGNQTEVDMMGIPMLYTFKGVDANNSKTTVKGGFSQKGARTKIFNAMKKAGLPWSHLVIDTRGGQPLREISPYNGIDSGRFSPTQLDAYINSVWSKYTGSKKLKANTTGPDQSFTGSVNGSGVLVFTRSTGGTISFPKPTTEEAYRGQFTATLSDPSDGDLNTAAGELVTMLQATFMRTTILAKGNISNCPTPGKAYYKNAPVNQYSKIIHEYAYQKKAYGFGYDDVCNQSSDGQVFQPTKVILNIPPFDK
ncbi:beta-1,3-glucanase family protein [Microbaculum marinum]|uniref:Beta-1,3-glucanase family protein n=1 Tax=Microbaculum marinum TaxID=1764581 RepID=A0AAW9S2H5_9HYPH